MARRANATTPLLANDDPSDSFDADERALLRQEENKQISRERRRLTLCMLLAIILTSSAVTFTIYFAKVSLGRSRNVIMMVSDGFGPASQTYARSYLQYHNRLPEDYHVSMDEILIGSSRTRSSDSAITDSAAGATAFSCALKTYNAAIGVDRNGNPCGTILEAAKDRGMLTGMVVKSRVTHATPASFSAHVVHRDMESEIAEQQIGFYPLGRQLDLLMGGGRCFFLPNSTNGSCRTDNRDLREESKTKGWTTFLSTREDFEKAVDGKIPLPALGLFNLDHMNYAIDSEASKELSLTEMAVAALDSLKYHSAVDKGFFLMIEGSRIDMGAHNNDPVAHLHDIIEYQETIAAVRKWVADNPNTLMISTSDHETGGFTLGSQPDPNTFPEYLWKPWIIEKAKASTEILTRRIFEYTGSDHKAFIKNEILGTELGITDATDEELTILTNTSASPLEILPFLGHMISNRAHLGWTTLGHTGVDVNLYADGEGFSNLRGNHENTEIGVTMASYLRVDLGVITKRLEQTADSWFKRRPFWNKNVGGDKHQETGR
ncbi:alkaline phosphatase [Entomortierella parvispora]|uniref:Alkaline phosphatase n=1 Tax=Entomortierella parvispora TaxID=205924 RepID=A0A9P3HL35_9FUNG|nr:alkaline phosphatase [Entomortierella parvispora]